MKYLFPALCIALLVALASSCKKDEPGAQKQQQTENPTDTSQTDTTLNDTSVVDTTHLPCNGDPSLCDKTYDELTFVMTHNAHAYTPVYSPLAANQANDVTTQLTDGVRALTFKTYYTDDSNCGMQDVYVYHGFAGLGCTPFADVLQEVKDFMDAHPREVITIGIEGSASVSVMKPVFDNVGLSSYLHVQELGQPWPTLVEMIDADKRLVVFTSRGTSANAQVDGFQDYWSFIVDNDYDAQSRTDFDCEWFRGDENGGLYLFNHFITRISPQPDSAQAINAYPVLMGRINECMNFHGRKPNFLHVDFYNYGDCLQVADELNGL